MLRGLAADCGAGLAEVVPGASTVLVLCAGAADLALLRPHLAGLLAGGPWSAGHRTGAAGAVSAGSAAGAVSAGSAAGAVSTGSAAGAGPVGAIVEIPVHYDGADLGAVGEETGLGAEGVVAAHSGAVYRGLFCGFAPGFCYLEGLPEELRLPRLAEPRPRVPCGSVAIADRYSAVYPAATPGGWRLIGHTDVRLWDSRRDPPALVGPGTAVRFRVLG